MSAKVQRVSGSSAIEKEMGSSRAVVVGDMIFVAGQLPYGTDGVVIDSNRIDNHFDQALKNVVAAVEAAGGQASDVITTTMFLTRYPNEEEFTGICESHRANFGGNSGPTGTMVYVPTLPDPAAMVQVMAIAMRR